MTIATHVLAQIEKRTAETEKTEGRKLREAVKFVIDLIPSIVAHANMNGKTSAKVMTLVEGRDYTAPWWHWIFRKTPHVETLATAPQVVFAWCQEVGLEPELAPGIYGNHEVKSHIVVKWTEESLGCINESAVNSYRVCALFGTNKTDRWTELYRERIRKVSECIELIEIELEYGDDNRDFEVTKVSGEEKPNETDIRYGNNWTSDVIKYCETLGLSVRLKTEREKNSWITTIIASRDNCQKQA